jgi:hypothetical protein
VAGAEPGGFRLACYQIACCAADAAPVVVRVLARDLRPATVGDRGAATGPQNAAQGPPAREAIEHVGWEFPGRPGAWWAGPLPPGAPFTAPQRPEPSQGYLSLPGGPPTGR